MSKTTPTLTKTEQKLRAFHDEEQIKQSYDSRLIRRIWPFVRPYKGYLFLSMGLLLLLGASKLIAPPLIGKMSAYAKQGNSSALRTASIVIIGVLLIQQLLNFAQTYFTQMVGAHATADLREHIFSFLQRLSLRFFDKTPVGRLVTRTTNDVDALGEIFSSGVISTIAELVSLLGIVIIMLVLNWKLACITFLATPAVAILVQFIRSRAKRAYRDIRTKTARMNAFLNEQVGGMSIVQAYNREVGMQQEFDEINLAYLDANKRSIFNESVLDAAIEMISTLCMATLLLWVGWHAVGWTGQKDQIEFNTVLTFVLYLTMFFEPIGTLSQRYIILQNALSAAERIFQLLDEKDIEQVAVDQNANAGVDSSAQEHAIVFDHVIFGYKPNTPVLKDVSFEIRRGEKIALVGATGAGKSTIASLVLRLYETTSGTIRLMGRDIKSYSREELRNLFAVVPQDVYLFRGTILSNIGHGESSPDLQRAEDALRHIGALAIFSQRPDGLLSVVEERGSNFSAGERQLLALARAVYRDAPILLLDEATANIDSATERTLQEALTAAMQNHTSLVIAHRLSTIKAVDRIIVFHKGHVVEMGSHEELVKRGGVYSHLYELQFAQN